jgi:hypothetical protein
MTHATRLAAQAPCTDAQAAATPGTWDRAAQVSDERFTGSFAPFSMKYPALAAKATQIVALIQHAIPAPTGVVVKVERKVNDRTLSGAGHARFGVRAMLFAYYCVPTTGYAPEFAGKVRAGEETSTIIAIEVNTLGVLAAEERQLRMILTADGAPIYFAPRDGGRVQNIPVSDPERLPKTKVSEGEVVLTAGDRSPWTTVTRGAFIDARIAFARHRLDSLNAQAAVLATPGGQRLKATLDAEQAELVAFRSGMSADDKALPALVSNFMAPPASLFVSASAGGRGLLTSAKWYRQKGRPPDEIQLISVYWSSSRTSPLEADAIRAFTERFDFDALRQMLSKE